MEETHTIKKSKKRFVFIGVVGALFCCALSLAALLLGGEEMDPLAKTQLDIANAAYQEGKFAEAEGAYRKVNDLAPGNPEVLKQLGNIALWKNRAQEAEQYYRDALRTVPWYANVWPLTSDLKYRLSQAYYRRDRFTDAATIIREAAGPISIGPFKDLDALGRQMELFAGQTPYEIEGPEQSRIEFVITDPLPVVALSVNNRPPMNFIIDTGGADIILDDDLGRDVGAEIGGTITGTYAGGKTAETGLGRVDSITIGDFLVRNVPVHILDTDPWSSEFNGMKIQGVVGTRFLMHFLSTIDYPGEALILRRTSPANLQNLNRQISGKDVKVIPFWLIDTHYIVAWGTVNSLEPMLFFVDTGLGGKGFTAPESVLQKAGVDVDWSKAGEFTGGGTEKTSSVDIVLRRLTLGAGIHEMVEIDMPGVAIHGSTPVLDGSLGFQVGGLISHKFFQKQSLTLDFTGMRLIVQ